VVLEHGIVDVMKFVSLYILWNLGFTLAFYTMQVSALTHDWGTLGGPWRRSGGQVLEIGHYHHHHTPSSCNIEHHIYQGQP